MLCEAGGVYAKLPSCFEEGWQPLRLTGWCAGRNDETSHGL